MAENSEIKWYVVHTYSGYENKVKVNLEKAVENNGMQDVITEVTIPTEEVVELSLIHIFPPSCVQYTRTGPESKCF